MAKHWRQTRRKHNQMIKSKEQSRVRSVNPSHTKPTGNTPTVTAPVPRSTPRKTKAGWLIESRQRARLNGECRFFGLPPEIRNRIYEFVFTPSTIIDLRNERTNLALAAAVSLKGNVSPMIRYAQIMGKRPVGRADCTKWCTSLSAIIPTNKQVYREAMPLLYRSCLFVFESKKLAYGFLKTVKKDDLRNIGAIRVEHEFPLHARNHETMSIIKLCHQLVYYLPNISSLEFKLLLHDELSSILPVLSTPQITYRAEHLDNLPWIQPLKAFTRLKKLKTVKVRLEIPSVEGLVQQSKVSSVAAALQNQMGLTKEQFETLAVNWEHWCVNLRLSLDDAVKRVMMRRDKEDVWEDHLQWLAAFQRWQLDPTSSWRDYAPDLPIPL